MNGCIAQQNTFSLQKHFHTAVAVYTVVVVIKLDDFRECLFFCGLACVHSFTEKMVITIGKNFKVSQKPSQAILVPVPADKRIFFYLTFLAKNAVAFFKKSASFLYDNYILLD